MNSSLYENDALVVLEKDEMTFFFGLYSTVIVEKDSAVIISESYVFSSDTSRILPFVHPSSCERNACTSCVACFNP